MRPGCQGIQQGSRANVLDALNLIKAVWDNDEKYATKEGIKRCWRKANILPPKMNADLNNDVGH